MKVDEKESGPKDPPAAKEEEKESPHPKSNSPQPSSSKDSSCNASQNSPESEQAKDALFEPTVDMLVNDFDEEQTLEEEEALAAKEQVDPSEELSDLQRESEMPIEELLKLYGCAPPAISSSGSGSRKRRRRREQTSPAKVIKIEESATEETTEGAMQRPTDPVSAQLEEENAEESPDEDGATTATTNTTNCIENQSLDDDTNYEDEEPSELKKLYTGLYERDENNGELKLEADDEDDLDYIPDEEEGKKMIMVGIDFQAIIPDSFVKYDDALPYENEDKLLWDPSKVKDDDIEDYLRKFSTTANGGTNHTASQGTGSKHLRDDEQALLLLVQCGNNFEEALRRRRLGSAAPTSTMSIWSEEECRNFENGLRMFGKSFHEIQASKVTTRSVGELVEFYYLWKKTERADIFTSKARLEKKKYNNPCAKHMDLMEKYLEEYENNGGGTNRERERDTRSVSPNVNSTSLLLADSKRHRGGGGTGDASSGGGVGNNNHNQHSHSPDKLMKQIDEGAAIKTNDKLE